MGGRNNLYTIPRIQNDGYFAEELLSIDRIPKKGVRHDEIKSRIKQVQHVETRNRLVSFFEELTRETVY